MKRAIRSVLFGCVFFFALGAATALAQSPGPVEASGGMAACNEELEGDRARMQKALDSLIMYSTGFTWTTPPTPMHKAFSATKQAMSCEQSMDLGMAALEQQVKDWGKSLNAQGIAPVPPFDNYHFKHNFFESTKMTVYMELILDTQLYSQGTPYLPTPE